MGHQTSEEELPVMASDHTLLLVGTTDSKTKKNRKLMLHWMKHVELPNYQMTNQLVLFVITFEAMHTRIKFADVPVTDPFVCNVDT